MPKKSKLEPYFTEIYLLRKQNKTLSGISNFIAEKYKIKCSSSMIKNLLDVRKKRDIKPNRKDIIDFLKSDNGSEKTIDLREHEQNKPIKTYNKKAPEETKTSNSNAGKLNEIMKELGIN